MISRRMMRAIAIPTMALLWLSACSAPEPLQEPDPRQARLIALDSLARTHPCSAIHATVLADPTVWTRRQACAVAGRALELLGAVRANEPYIAPTDTAHVAVIRIERQRLCEFSPDSGVTPPGRMDSLAYVVWMDVPSRLHLLNAAMNAHTLAGGASFAEHPRDTWGVPFILTQPIERPDSLEAGAPCGG